GFEQSELEKPRKALQKAGAETAIVSPHDGEVKGWAGDNFGDSFDVDVALGDADPDDYDALLLPGGVMNPDQLRQKPEAVGVGPAVFPRGKTGRRVLSRTAAADRGGGHSHPPPHLLSVAEDRPQKRRREMGRRGGGGRWQPRDEPQTVRHPALQCEDDRTDRG